MNDLTEEIAAAAARLIVDEGMDWGPAKQRAARDAGAPRAALPGNDAVEAAVLEHLLGANAIGAFVVGQDHPGEGGGRRVGQG